MKLLNKAPYILFFLFSMLFFSCSKKTSVEEPEKPPVEGPSHNKLVKITSVNPTTGLETPSWLITYNSKGKVGVAQSNNVVFAVEYNSDDRISKITKTASGGKPTLITLEYDAQGNLFKQYEEGVGTTYYVYNDNKVFRAYYGAVPSSIYSEYTWSNGNLVQQSSFYGNVLQLTTKNPSYDDKANALHDLEYFMLPAGILGSLSKNNTLGGITINADGTSGGSSTYSYTYNSLGYVATSQVTTSSGVIAKSKYYYGE